MATARPNLGLPTVGVDLGGTKIASAVVDENGNVYSRCELQTPQGSASAVIAGIEEAVGAASQGQPVGAIGIGAAGLVLSDRSTILYAPNLPLERVPLGANLLERFGVPVTVENDANAAAWAEWQFGAGAGLANMVMLTIGTGVGGGVILDGKLHRGVNGIAAEIGHLAVTDTGPACGCGSEGCLESLASGTALVREARRLATEAPHRATKMLGLVGGQAMNISGPGVTFAALHGDEAAQEAFARVGNWLGRGLASLVALLDVNVIVIGGGVAAAGNVLLEPAVQSLNSLLIARHLRPRPAVRLARLGNDGGLIGSAALACV